MTNKYNSITLDNFNIINDYYNKDDVLFLNSYLNSKIFIKSYDEVNEKIIFPQKTLQLIVRPECNQKCDYCYITKYGNELYPKEERVNNQIILNNLKKLLIFLNYKKTFINSWDIFAGDLFYDNFWFDIMDIFYNYYIELFDNNHSLLKFLKENNEYIYIGNPNNCSFCQDKEKIKKVQKYIDKFKELNILIFFSYSHDGPFNINIREKREINEEYYHNVFTFLKFNGFGCHPMVSYEGIENSIQNYEWWKKQYNLYNLNQNGKNYLPMFLEVRNDGWTKEKIQKYLEFLNYMIEDRLKMCNNNIIELAKNILKNHQKKLLPSLSNNDLIKLVPINKNSKSTFSCVLGHAISIKLNNLSIVPCHRMAYPKFEIGTINIDNFIIDIKNNADAYYAMTEANTLMLPGCAQCHYRFFCPKGCIGSQYETYGDWNVPVKSVCDLFKAKYDFLFKKYHELNLFHYYFQNDEIFNSKNSVESRRYLEFLLMKGYKEYEQYL